MLYSTGRALGAALLCLAPTLAHAEARPWTLGTVAPEGSVYADLTAQVAQIIEESAGVRVRRRLGGILGTESETVDLVAQDRLELYAGSLGAVVDRVPALGVLEIPYLFPDAQALTAGLRRLGRGRAAALQAPCEKEHLELVSIGGVGWRDLSSLGKPILSVEDLRGLRARSQPGPIHRAMWRSVGATPTDTSLQELAAALQTFDLQTLDVPITFLIGTSAHERVRAITRTRHTPQLIVLVASRRAWSSLTAAQRERIRARVDKATERTAVRAGGVDEELLAFLMGRGVRVIDPSPAALLGFRAIRGRVEELLEPMDPQQKRILATLRGE